MSPRKPVATRLDSSAETAVPYSFPPYVTLIFVEISLLNFTKIFNSKFQVQEKLLQTLGSTGKPLVVVLNAGSALAVNWAAEHANAILSAWYSGEIGGQAITDTLLGTNNPGGKLPLTYYASDNDLPEFTNYEMEGRTYKYFRGKPLFPFGHGLSYTTFEYSNAKLSTSQLNAGDNLKLEVSLKNTGGVDGDEVRLVEFSHDYGAKFEI